MSEKTLSILLIDDDDHDNFFHKRAIVKSGLDCHVQVCTSGLDALELLQRKGQYESLSEEYCNPDLIFLDINMPRFNGWDFLAAYASLPDTDLKKTHVNIVMLSTSSSPQTRERALETAYVKDFIEKPLRPETLQSLVAKYLTDPA